MSNNEISVEVYRDVECRGASIDAVETGVDIVSRITTGIQIVRATRLIRIAAPERDSVNIDKIRWPNFDADMNIVLTERPIRNIAGTALQQYGVSERGGRLHPLGVAVVDIKHPDFPGVVVAHEMGHLFGLKDVGDSWDGESHCRLSSCLMQRYAQTVERRTPAEARGLRKLSERIGLSSVQFETAKHPKSDEFCQECARQLDKSAFFLKEFKSGKNIPGSWF